MDGTIEKSHGGALPGPRGGAEAGVRREAPHSGRSGGPRARRGARAEAIFGAPKRPEPGSGASGAKTSQLITKQRG